MTTNFVLPNNGLPQTNMQPQHSVVTQRNKAISVGGATAVHVTPHYPSFSQSYPVSNAMDASWAHGPQGVYVNGLGKMVNVFTESNVPEVDDTIVNRSNEPYKYAQDLKLSGAPHAGGQIYQHSSMHGVNGPTHGTLQTPVQLTAMVAAPNGVAHSHTGALCADSLNMVHSHGTHQTQSTNHPGLSVFVPGYLGQHQQHASLPHPQNAISPSIFTDNTTVLGIGTNTNALSTYHAKHVSSLSGPTDRRIISTSQPSFAHLPMAQHSGAALHNHSQIYPASSLQHPPPPQLTNSLPHGIVELIPTMFTATDPHGCQTPFSQPSTAALYGPYSAQLPTAVSATPCEPITLPIDGVTYTTNSRVRHNTWSGLESTLSSRKADPSAMDENAGGLGSERTGTDRHRTFSHRVSGQGLVNVYPTASNTAYNLSTLHAPNNQSKTVRVPLVVQNSSSSTHEAPHFNNVYEKPNKAPTGQSVWHPNLRQWPIESHINSAGCGGGNVAPRSDNAGMEGVYNLYSGASRIEFKDVPSKPPFVNVSCNLPLLSEKHSSPYFDANHHMNPIRNRNVLNPNGVRWPAHQSAPSVFRPTFQPRPSLSLLMNGVKPNTNLDPSSNNPTVSSSKLPIIDPQWNNPYAYQDPTHANNLMHATPNSFSWSGGPAQPYSPAAPAGRNTEQLNWYRQRFVQPHLNGNAMIRPAEPWLNSAVIRQDHISSLTNRNNGLRMLFEACPLRILISTLLVGAVIGRAGRTIRRMTARTGAQIDFKSETVAFSQFSSPGRIGSKLFSPVSTNKSDSPNPTLTEDPNVNQPEPTECIGSPTAFNETRTDRSQLVYVSGNAGQRSSALAEILTICFREAGHKGLPEPCLGLVIQQQIYTQLIVGQGRKYFNAIYAETGARVTATGSPVYFKSPYPATQHSSSPEPNVDRILVIRGSLVSICVAESLISEQVRILTAELFIPFILWPLLPHLPLAHWSSAHSNKTAANSINGLRSDLQTISHSLLSIADVFWPQSIASSLSKHPSFAHINFSHTHMNNSTDQPLTSSSSTPSKTADGCCDQVVNSDSLSPVQNSSSIDLSQISSNLDPQQSIHQPEEHFDRISPVPDVPATDSEDGSVAEHQQTDLTDDVGTNLNEEELALAIAVQQSLVATVGPLAWLATSGTLHLRVSFNEAGVLIGAGGHRIHQLMKATGAEVHISKTPINGPYALDYPHEDLSKGERRPSIANSSPLTCSQPTVVEDVPILDEVLTSSIGPLSIDVSTTPTNLTLTPVVASPQPQSDQESFTDANQMAEESTNFDAADSFPPTEDEQIKPDPCCSATLPYSSTAESQQTSATSHRLVTLSGPFYSQLMAQWKIFQRLKLLHDRTESMKAKHAEDNMNEDQKPASSHPSDPFRLSTIVCLPFRFLCWLASSNSGFADFMSTSKSPTKLTEPEKRARLPTVCPIRTESNSPLSWLRSQAESHHEAKSPHSDCESTIHILPEPRRRRRLIQQQLRRMTGTMRRGPTGQHLSANIVLPSTGLTNDGLDALWSDPNRAPLEVFGDYETTQVILAHLHHMLALWLYGQALTNPTGLAFIPSQPQSPFPLHQATATQSPYFVLPSMWVPGGPNQRSPAPSTTMGSGSGDNEFRCNLAWLASYSKSALSMHHQQQQQHRGQAVRFGAGWIPNPEFAGHTNRHRVPNSQPRWRYMGSTVNTAGYPRPRPPNHHHSSGVPPFIRSGATYSLPLSTNSTVITPTSPPDHSQSICQAHPTIRHECPVPTNTVSDSSSPSQDISSRSSSPAGLTASQSPDLPVESISKPDEVVSLGADDEPMLS